jgi:alpha-1,6-mannosyltransferase
LIRRKIGKDALVEIIKAGVLSSLFSLLVSIPVDTFFWGLQYDIRYRTDPHKLFLMWPELHSFYFNGVENKSNEWGVSPWHWYFLNAIPKSVTCAIPFLLVGLVYQRRETFGFLDRQAVDMLGPALVFVGIFSFLPHKELRFIFPSLTLFNLAGAYGLSKM